LLLYVFNVAVQLFSSVTASGAVSLNHNQVATLPLFILSSGILNATLVYLISYPLISVSYPLLSSPSQCGDTFSSIDHSVDNHLAVIVISSAGIVIGISLSHHPNTYPVLVGSVGVSIAIP
jgi:hypothetical protein